MECSMSNYDNTDFEESHTLDEMDKKIKKELEKKVKPSVKPSDVFQGYSEKKKVKGAVKTKKKGLSGLRFEKRQVCPPYRYGRQDWTAVGDHVCREGQFGRSWNCHGSWEPYLESGGSSLPSKRSSCAASVGCRF